MLRRNPPGHTVAPAPIASDGDRVGQEYSELSSDLRTYTTLRFTIFTVYLVALGSLSSVAFGLVDFHKQDPATLMRWSRLAGLVVTALFFYYEVRVQSLINHAIARGQALERQLNFSRLSSRPSWGMFRSHHATNIFFTIVTCFWLFAFVGALRW